jgi:uncharacterized protein with PIN domain
MIAILQAEPEAATFRDIMIAAGEVCMSAVSLQEASMVLAGHRPGQSDAWADLDTLEHDRPGRNANRA